MRRFVFERSGAPGVREKFTVEADTVMARRYRIAMQELPLLCRRLLDAPDADGSRALVFTEAHMSTHAGLAAPRSRFGK